MILKMIKMVLVTLVAVMLLVLMTPWALLTNFMAIVLDWLNRIYSKLIDYLIKTGEGI